MVRLNGRPKTPIAYRTGGGFAHPLPPRAFRRMRILIVSSNPSRHGAVVYAGRIRPLLAARGHAVWPDASSRVLLEVLQRSIKVWSHIQHGTPHRSLQVVDYVWLGFC